MAFEAPAPTGLLQLLLLATSDDRFRTELLARRSALASATDVSLGSSERAILDGVPETQLAAMIDRLPPPPADRRALLRKAAAAALGELPGSAYEACSEKRAAKPPGASPRTTRPAQPQPPSRPDKRKVGNVGKRTDGTK